MLEKLQDVSTTAIEKLGEIQRQQEHLKGCVKKAKELRGKVSKHVYQKVLADYENRHAALQKESESLEADAQGEYQKLRSIYEEVRAACDAAISNEHELKFRVKVGEFTESGLQAPLRECREVLEHSRTTLAEVERLMKQFLEVFPSGDGAAPTAEPLTQSKTRLRWKLPKSTSRDDKEARQDGETPFAEAEERPSQPFVDDDRTIIVPDAMLVIDRKGAQPLRFRLAALNAIGSSKGNHIRVTSAGVSRRHASITVTPSGFRLKDLKSRNGTYVNKKRVKECILADGDCVRIGMIELVFRLC